jgi:hypothetical protein
VVSGEIALMQCRGAQRASSTILVRKMRNQWTSLLDQPAS